VNASGELPTGCRASYHAEPIAPASAGLDAVAVTVRVTFPDGAEIQAPGLYGYRRCYAAAYARAAASTARQYVRLHRAAPAAGEPPAGDGDGAESPASAEPAAGVCSRCKGRGSDAADTGRGTTGGTCPACDGRGAELPAGEQAAGDGAELPPRRWTADGLGDVTRVHDAPHAPAAPLYEVTVPSASRAGVEYRVTRDGTGWHCTCPHHRFRGAACKHIRAARIGTGPRCTRTPWHAGDGAASAEPARPAAEPPAGKSPAGESPAAQGREAWHDGRFLDACPHATGTPDARAWRDAWEDERLAHWV
jgi:hypothetical protein